MYQCLLAISYAMYHRNWMSLICIHSARQPYVSSPSRHPREIIDRKIVNKFRSTDFIAIKRLLKVSRSQYETMQMAFMACAKAICFIRPV